MKSRIGILTDNTAQFTAENFLGSQLVHTLSFNIIERIQSSAGDGVDVNDQSVKHGNPYQISLPSEEIIREVFVSLCDQYDEIIILIVSKHVNPLYFMVEEAINKHAQSAHFHLIDSQTLSIGLGLLVQIAASSAYRGFSMEEIKKNIRSVVPKIYSLYCVKNLSYLYFSGLLDPAQAVIGELLGMSPCLLMENGRFIPTHKAKSLRHITELFLEFTSEFENLRNIALLYGDGYKTQDFQPFRSRINHQFSTASFSESKINRVVSTLLGPQTTGLVLMENV